MLGQEIKGQTTLPPDAGDAAEILALVEESEGTPGEGLKSSTGDVESHESLWTQKPATEGPIASIPPTPSAEVQPTTTEPELPQASAGSISEDGGFLAESEASNEKPLDIKIPDTVPEEMVAEVAEHKASTAVKPAPPGRPKSIPEFHNKVGEELDAGIKDAEDNLESTLSGQNPATQLESEAPEPVEEPRANQAPEFFAKTDAEFDKGLEKLAPKFEESLADQLSRLHREKADLEKKIAESEAARKAELESQRDTAAAELESVQAEKQRAEIELADKFNSRVDEVNKKLADIEQELSVM